MADDLHAVDFGEAGIQPFMEFVPLKRLHGVSLTHGPLLDIRKSRRGAPVRACFKNRPVRGPDLQGFGILAISRRPRALTRRPSTILKHAPNPPSDRPS